MPYWLRGRGRYSADFTLSMLPLAQYSTIVPLLFMFCL